MIYKLKKTVNKLKIKNPDKKYLIRILVIFLVVYLPITSVIGLPTAPLGN